MMMMMLSGRETGDDPVIAHIVFLIAQVGDLL